MTTFFPKPLDKQVAALSDSLSQTQDGLAIVANGNTHAAISSGQFVYVKNHDTLAEGVYKATSAIAQDGALSTSNLTADGTGGLNDLQGQVTALNSKFVVQTGYLTKVHANITDVEFAYYIKYGRVCIVRLHFTVGTQITDNIGILFSGAPKSLNNTRTTLRNIASQKDTNFARLAINSDGYVINQYTPGGIPADQYEGEIVYITRE